MDGDSPAVSTVLVNSDRLIINDDGVMKQVSLTDVITYLKSSLDSLENITKVGTLDSGSISSGFGSIDIGESTITTSGLITGGGKPFN